MSILRNINYMKRFVYHPCASPNPIMMIEFAVEAGLPVLYELLSMDILDKALKSGKDAWRQHNRNQDGSGSNAGRGTPPPSGHGRRLTGRVGRKSFGQAYSAREFLFELVDAEQTGMFWWMVADLYTEFLARWVTLMYLKQGCPFDHSCFAEGDFGSIYIDVGIVPILVPILHTGVLTSGGYGIQQVRKGPFSITYTAKLERFLSPLPPSSGRVMLVNANDTTKVYADGAGGGVSPLNERLSGGFRHFDNGDDLQSYTLVLVNETPGETVRVKTGHLTLSSGFCDNSAPLIPYDIQHLAPYPR